MPKLAQDQDLADFEVWWSHYPRHVAKADARKAWKQTAKIRPTTALLVSAVEAQKGTEQWGNVRFIPYAATWLRGERWNDSCDCSTPETNHQIWERACAKPTLAH